MEKDQLIQFILANSVSAKEEELSKLSVDALKMIKVQIDLELLQRSYN